MLYNWKETFKDGGRIHQISAYRQDNSPKELEGISYEYCYSCYYDKLIFVIINTGVILAVV